MITAKEAYDKAEKKRNEVKEMEMQDIENSIECPFSVSLRIKRHISSIEDLLCITVSMLSLIYCTLSVERSSLFDIIIEEKTLNF